MWYKIESCLEILTGSGAWNNVADSHGAVSVDASGGAGIAIDWWTSGQWWGKGSSRWANGVAWDLSTVSWDNNGDVGSLRRGGRGHQGGAGLSWSGVWSRGDWEVSTAEDLDRKSVV